MQGKKVVALKTLLLLTDLHCFERNSANFHQLLVCPSLYPQSIKKKDLTALLKLLRY